MKRVAEEQLDKFYVDLSVGNYTRFEFIKALSEYCSDGIIMELSLWNSLKGVVGSFVYDSNYNYKEGELEYFLVWRCKESKSVITCNIDIVNTSGIVLDTCKLKIKVI